MQIHFPIDENSILVFTQIPLKWQKQYSLDYVHDEDHMFSEEPHIGATRGAML